jgi:Fe-S oxidoreductase
VGFAVQVPEQRLCCGRPLYDYGMLTLAERQLRLVLGALRAQIEAGVPVVALEPSCGAVFRDELIGLLPHDEDAKRLARQTFSLGEFLAQHAPGWQPRPLGRKAVVHLHCHQRATTDTDCDTAVLERLGVDAEVLDSGCCGVAGSFAYESDEKHEVAEKAGERVLLPAVRAAPADTLIVTDGFSCRSQVSHGTQRRAHHLAEVCALALDPAPVSGGR